MPGGRSGGFPHMQGGQRLLKKDKKAFSKGYNIKCLLTALVSLYTSI